MLPNTTVTYCETFFRIIDLRSFLEIRYVIADDDA